MCLRTILILQLCRILSKCTNYQIFVSKWYCPCNISASSFSAICSCLDTICSVSEQLSLLMRFREKICSIQKTAIKVKKNNNYIIDNFRMKTILMNLDDENNISNNTAMIIITNKILLLSF